MNFRKTHISSELSIRFTHGIYQGDGFEEIYSNLKTGTKVTVK
jgi:hypothetical protein